MTSEVLILNRLAVIIAADSAITSSGGEHPRYSKAATKVFDLSESGTVALAFFGSALMDCVPWEVSVKLFRKHLGRTRFDRVTGYMDALITFLSANPTLFPESHRAAAVEIQFDNAVLEVIKHVRATSPQVVDGAVPLAERRTLWAAAAADIGRHLGGVVAPLTASALAAVTSDTARWVPRVQRQLAQVPLFEAIDAGQLSNLAHQLRYARPDLVLSETGLVIAGYGEADIFPAYRQVAVFGHIGDELHHADRGGYEISHMQAAWIQPLAQTSMIDTFTDGFGQSLQTIIETASRKALRKVIDDLVAAGIPVPASLGDQIATQGHADFMTEWKRDNWRQNFTPLIHVLATLDVQEMGYLAETLLGLQSLKERVTSPTEEVGGPIDVASITRAEGLVWIKRKHYFSPEINLRYAARVHRSTTT